MTRVIVIAGGGGGIGSAVAIRQACEGDRVAIWDRDAGLAEAAASQVRAQGGEAFAVCADLTDEDQVTAATDQVLDTYGEVTGLFTCVGLQDFGEFDSITRSRWDRMLAVNLTSCYLAAHALAPAIRAQAYGRMVFTSSMAGISGSPRHVHYATAKTGIIGFAKALAKELGPNGITVNVVAPGAIATAMLDDVPDQVMKAYANNPAGRVGTPEEVAHVVSGLLAEQAGFVTGAVFNVNGGALT